MEQSIDSNKKPEFAAGTDPAFIPLPGLAAPAGARKTEAEPEDGPQADPELDEAPEAAAEEAPEPEADATADAEAEAEAPEDGPVFEVSDRRGSIRVAREGIRFTLDDQEADFDWSEIGAVEMHPARFGRRFTVTVHLSTRRWFNAEVEAESRARLKEWPAELDAVLDAYFEES
ncbi:MULTISPECIES: hypothetical protein [Streptomyces]|uniref:hypothetical protein n=1 Tax=Streptomyces TaxID=1883 RepID=UPI000D519524|nr:MULTISPECIES: hypothetical protein [Streptomyces]MXG29825.1 hypothetical protein [Streptomyces sp. YIM 132580]PVC78283.1 hypothetical protein DBP15_05605 [Streptomyces sp. CS065A]